MFFAAVLPRFVSRSADAARQRWILAVTFAALAIVNASLFAVFAASARKLMSSPRTSLRFNLAGGTLLSAAGIWALMAKR